MNDFTTNTIDIHTAPRFRFSQFFLKLTSAILFMLAFYGISSAQTTYTFTGEMDSHYENPANWTPAYPGTEISENSLVFIEGMAIATEEIRVSGMLHISLGASLEVAAADLSILSTGKLMNDGELMAATIHNEGMLNNNFAATLKTAALVAYEGAMTNNLMSAEIQVEGDLSNGGVFNNYSNCTVKGDFIQAFSFNELHNSEMTISGRHIEQLTPVADARQLYKVR